MFPSKERGGRGKSPPKWGQKRQEREEGEGWSRRPPGSEVRCGVAAPCPPPRQGGQAAGGEHGPRGCQGCKPLSSHFVLPSLPLPRQANVAREMDFSV